MKKLLFIFCFSAAILPCSAQDCYRYLRQKGIEAFGKTEFAAALQKFEGARQCPDAPASNDLDAWIGKTNRRLDPPKPKPARNTPPLVETLPQGQIHWSEGFALAKGQCLIDRKRYPQEPQALLMAQRGAEVLAKANLLETIQGIVITRTTTVHDFIVQSDAADARTAGVLRMARLVGEPLVANGIVEVTMQAPLYQLSAFVVPVAPQADAGHDSLEQRLYISSSLARPSLFPVITDETGAILYDAETRYRQTGRPAFRYGQAALPETEAPANLHAQPNPDNSLRIDASDWPLLRQWLEAAEQGRAMPVRLVFP